MASISAFCFSLLYIISACSRSLSSSSRFLDSLRSSRCYMACFISDFSYSLVDLSSFACFSSKMCSSLQLCRSSAVYCFRNS